jgi:hypothetical protein
MAVFAVRNFGNPALVITPGTAVFIKARAAESEQRPCFYRPNNFVKHSSSDLVTDGHAKKTNSAAFQMGHVVSSRFPEQIRNCFTNRISAFELWGNSCPSAPADRLPTRVELDAVFASGRDHDYTQLKHLVAKLDGRVSELDSRVGELEAEVLEAS